MIYFCCLLICLISSIDAHKHTYVIKNLKHRRHISNKSKLEYHGLDHKGRLIVSSPIHVSSNISSILNLGLFENKIIGVVNNSIIVETSYSPQEVYNDLRPLLPLSHNVTLLEHGFVLGTITPIPWYVISIIEGHQSVLSISQTVVNKFKPNLIHASRVLISNERPDIDYKWEDDIITIGDSGLDINHCAFQDNINTLTNSDIPKYTYNGRNRQDIETGINHEKTNIKIKAYVRFQIPPGLIDTDYEDPISAGGHGTHVSGIVAGNGCIGRTNNLRVLMFDFMKSGQEYLQIPPFFTDLLLLSYNAGSRVMTNSWGDLEGGKTYTVLARDMDEFLLSHDDYMIIQASGNDGEAGVHSPGNFKNGITVGASMNSYQSWLDNFPLDPFISTRPEIYSEQNLFDYSSRGRAGGRIKPTLVAPGGYIISAKSGGGLHKMMGTSMATPLLAWRYLMIRAQLPKSLSALIPLGVMIGSAQPLKGDVVQYSSIGSMRKSKVKFGDDGWGLATSKPDVKAWRWIDRVEMDEGVKEWCFKSEHKGRTHVVVLLWRDIPNWPGSQGELLVDYDLRVVMSGHKVEKEVLMLGDHVNNIEKIKWRSMKHEHVRVQVYLSSTPRDYHHAMKFSLVYSKGLKPVDCLKGERECEDDESPGWLCRDGGVRVCEGGKWTRSCYKSARFAELNRTDGSWGCYMSTSEFKCDNGSWTPWDKGHEKRKLNSYWSLSALVTSPGDLVTFDTFIWSVSVATGVPLVLIIILLCFKCSFI